MYKAISRLAAVAILSASVMMLGCGAQGPDDPEALAAMGGADSSSGQGGDDSSSGAGGDGMGGDDSSSGSGNGSGNGSGSGSGNGSGSGSSGGMGETCSIMSSNTTCASCLEQYCCEVINECMDEDLFSCVSCMDCFLEGNGPDCCDQSVGKNSWMVECVAFNCVAECGS